MSSPFSNIDEEVYFSNNININDFSQSMINDLTSLKTIKELVKENNSFYSKIEAIENSAFNLLINQIELEKENSKVEVGVIGSFSSGKSTFINSLFGEAVCPMAVKPTTSSITKFYYGDREKITINGKEISKKEYHSYAQHLKGDSKNTKTYYIEYAYPFERLNSIILYDTPGFNNNLNTNDTAVTMKTLESVDVIFFIIDISKGAIDMSSIEMLYKFKEKRIYCILNKSDLKSEQGIAKIKKQITSENIFLEVIDYSASKVLEFGEKNYFTDYIQHIENNLISKQIDFTTNIKGLIKETKTRLKTKIEYQLYIDDNKFIIDDFYISSKKQRERIEKMLNRISDSKKFTLEQKLKLDRYKYEKESLELMQQELEKYKNTKTINHLNKFEENIRQFVDEVHEFEIKIIDIFYKELNYIFKTSCEIKEVSKEEKSFWSTPYRKIYFNQYIFRDKIKKMDSLKYMKELIGRWIDFFQNNYNIYLTIIDFESNIAEEAEIGYSKFCNSTNYILNSEGDIFFEDKLEAQEYLEHLKSFEYRDKINSIHSFLEVNQEKIETIKKEFYTKDLEENNSIHRLKEELNNFIKEKKEYVK